MGSNPTPPAPVPTSFAFVVRHGGNVARFRIRNSRELTAEEHPWVNDLALALQRSHVDGRGFRVP
ncbi:MAG: hypothetical protein WD186_01340 [Actinomycetota bacterium]